MITQEETEKMVDDISDAGAVDMGKLAALKAKSKEKEAAVSKIVAKKERALNFGVLGTGQGGSRLAESFFALGYDAVICNTATQDLKFCNLPDSNKLLLEYGVGGASKELSIGASAAEAHRAEILQLVNEKLGSSQINILCTSLGGGSGAGSVETMIDVLTEIGKPILVLSILPMETEDAQAKANSVETLSKLTAMVKSKKIANLICVDNAKIETIYADVSQMDFYGVANRAIVNPIDAFNTLSAMPSSSKGLDPMELTKLLIDGEGLSIFGELVVSNFQEDTALAEAVIGNLNDNLLSGGFDLKQTKYAGFILAANAQVWAKIPSSSVNYAVAMVNELAGTPRSVFKGIYVTDDPSPVVKVYSFFSGLHLPATRVDQLKKDAAELQGKGKVKDAAREQGMVLDTGTNDTVSAAQKIREKVAAKNSTFGKFLGGSVSDRRK
jgi:cell division GTPase FtsZ